MQILKKWFIICWSCMPLEDPTLPMCLLRIYLPLFILKIFLLKKGGCIRTQRFFLVQCCWSISVVWEVSGCHHWFYFLFSSSGPRDASRENWWPLVSGSDVILWQAEAGGHCCWAEWEVKDALSAVCALSCYTASWCPATPACIASCYKRWNHNFLGRNH